MILGNLSNRIIDKIYEILQKRLGDFYTFIEYINQFIKQPEKWKKAE